MQGKKLEPIFIYGDGKGFEENGPAMFNLSYAQVGYRSRSLQHCCHQTYVIVRSLKTQRIELS